MAWRIHDQVVRGEIDNRTLGRVSGRVWLEGWTQPVRLALEGNCWRDLAGCVVRFENPRPQSGALLGLAVEQNGVCGDMTASRKVQIAPEPVHAWLAQGAPGKETLPWGNCLYLEWFSDRNGRVVIESTHYKVEISEPLWNMTKDEEREQGHKNQEAIQRFMVSLVNAAEPPGTDSRSTDQQTAELDETETETEDGLPAEIEALKQKARELAGGDLLHCPDEDSLPLEIQSQFWRNVVAFELAPQKCQREVLAEAGYTAPPEAGLSDAELELELWRLIEILANHRIFLDSTDHLSDRELYKSLVEHVLEEETEVMPSEADWIHHISMQGFGNEGEDDGTEIYLRYYATPEERANWAEDFPDGLPPHCDPMYDRDRNLPQPPF